MLNVSFCRDSGTVRIHRALYFLIVALFSGAVDASDLIPADCDTALNDQQLALGDFIYAQRAEQDVRGREGRSGDIVQLAQSACE